MELLLAPPFLERAWLNPPSVDHPFGLTFKGWPPLFVVEPYRLDGFLGKYPVYGWVSQEWMRVYELKRRIRERLARPRLNPRRIPD